jgi:probable HAF family extracellular repeat protein
MGINERGDVVGSSETLEPGVVHAFLWTEAGGMRDLGTLGGDQSAAFGVNNLRQVVGNSEIASRAQRPFLWTRRGGMLDLAPNSEQAGNAVAINDFGVVAGNLQGQGIRAFRWTRWSGLVRLKNLGGTIGLAADINDFGVIVGVSRNANDVSHAAVWIGREPIDIDPGIGGLFSEGRAITNRGLVAGLVRYDNIGTFDAVIWNPAQWPFTASVGKRALCQRRSH